MRGVDTIFAGMSEVHRGLVALVGVGMVMLTLGIAIGSMGLRDDVDQLARQDERMASDIATNRANAAANASAIAAIQSIIQQTGLVEMSERVRRIDRELCLLRADRAGSVTSEMQQECARR